MTEQHQPPSSAPTSTGPTPKPSDGQTSYIVFEFDKSSTGWKSRKTVNARSSDHAVRLYAAGLAGDVINPEPLHLVAVSYRSWNPVTVSAKIATSFVVEAAE